MMRRKHEPLGILVAADDGLYHAEPSGGAERTVDGRRFTRVEYYDGLGAAVAPDDGVWVFAGRRWEQAWEGEAYSVSVTPSGSLLIGTADGGLVRSDDQGESWEEIEGARNLFKHNRFTPPEGEARAAVASVAEVNEGLIVGVSGGGGWHTRDGGKSWIRRSDGLDPKLHRLWTHPENRDRLFATADTGIFRSEDEGYTWIQSINGIDRSWAGTLAVMPGAPDALIATVAREASGRDGALFRSPNGGVTWSRLMLDDEDEWERIPVVVRPWDWEDVAFVSAGDGIWASHDRGKTWVGLGKGFPFANGLSASL